jgi:alanine dehydrogenase
VNVGLVASMRQIDAAEINQRLPMIDCIEAMERMFAQEKEQISSQPLRLLTTLNRDSLIMCMPAHSMLLNRYAVKIVSEFKLNPKLYSLPIQGGVIVFIDSLNSTVLALLDSPAITEIRTAAVSGLATKLLSRKDSESVGIIGSGAESRRILEAVLTVRPKLKSAKVFSLHFSNAQRFANEMSKMLGLPVEAHNDRKQVMSSADILIVATNSKSPVTNWSDVKPGCHINSIGVYQTEIDESTVQNSALFVDSKQSVLAEAKDVSDAIKAGKISEDHIRGDLGEVLDGSKRGRTIETEVTLFKSVGFALQDVYACSYVVDRSLGTQEGGVRG